MAIRGLDASTPERALRSAGTAAAGSNWQSTLARWGLVAKGILYAALGVLAIQVAAGDTSSSEATRRGAIELVAGQPFGQVLLGILTFGLFALAVWQVLLAFKGDPVEGSEATDRAKYAGKALIYGATGVTAFGILTGGFGGGSGGGASEDRAASTLMSLPGGPWIVGIIGAAIVGAAVYQFYLHGLHTAFMGRLRRSQMDPQVESGVERAGRMGYIARAIVLAIAGVFFIIAAVQHDPQQAVGLSGALAALSGATWGQAVLWVVAVGLFLYGLFCFAEARYRRAT